MPGWLVELTSSVQLVSRLYEVWRPGSLSTGWPNAAPSQGTEPCKRTCITLGLVTVQGRDSGTSGLVELP